VRINAAARANGTTYSRLAGAMRKAGVALDRKVLAEIALALPADFAAVVRASQA
jgi:large subunit ribosomal protein L20